MYVLLVKIQIKPDKRDAFIEAMKDDARGSNMDEPGCLRFDVIQDENDPNTIYLYEVYKDRAAFDAHTKAPHFIRWRDTVKDWYAAPSQVWRGNSIYPIEEKWLR